VPPELASHPKYLILRELGRGGMGVVYQARQTVMDRPVVIKVVNRAILEHRGVLDRFRREVQSAAQLSHPNIVTAYDAEQAGGTHMLVMEFVPGQSLAEMLEKKGPLPVEKACQYVRQAAAGLHHAYKRNMVHRDIKPSNLMLTPQGQVKILDFGLAKIISERETEKGLTESGAYMGTPDYCAPEQAEDARTADIRADIYSLGCTLYCLLAGRPPFQEDTPMKAYLAHRQKQPQPLTELRPDVPERLWRVIARLLAKEPKLRYQKPSEVVLALAPFVKPSSKVGTPLPQGTGSPLKETAIETDSEIEKIVREGHGKVPPKKMPSREDNSLFADLRDAGTDPMPSRPAWWKRPGVLAAAFGVSLALIMLAVIIIKIKVETTPSGGTGNVTSSTGGTHKTKPPPAEAIVVLEIDQPGAEVLVDGKTIIVNAPGENEPIEVKVGPGQHRVEVKKDGFNARGEEVTLEIGGRRIITARLEKKQPPLPAPLPDSENTQGAPDGFVPLFNGKDIENWEKVPPQEPVRWMVIDGKLIAVGVFPAGILRTKRVNFTDFMLRMEVETTGETSDGIILRCCDKDGRTRGYGISVGAETLGKVNHFELGKEWRELLPAALPSKPGTNVMLEIMLQGNWLRVGVNGKEVVNERDLANAYSEGGIALRCSKATTLKIRKIEIKELNKGKATTTASGLKYEDLKEGTGAAAKKGDTVHVYYLGWLTSGKKVFDNRHGFKLGTGWVIKGFEEGVAGMRVGGKRRLTIPPELAYGKRGADGLIPPDATLILEVELLEIK
jgi:serine/threonine protein kinase